MKRFIGIGAEHKVDVFDIVQNILRKENPSAITLETKIDLFNRTDSSDNPRLKERKTELLQLPNYEVVLQGRNTILKVNDLFVYGHPNFSEDMPELSAGIDFALRQGLPFYFVEYSLDFPNYIFELKNGKVQAISLGGCTTYQDYPDEFMEFRGKILIGVEHVDARNRFSSDAINFLSKFHSSLAHIGGSGHFDSSTEPTVCFGSVCRLSAGLELQNLVKSEEKIVYDLADNNSE